MSDSSSAPLMLVDGEDLLYHGSSVKKHDLLMLVMAFTLHFKLTATATQGLLDLLNVIIPGCVTNTLYVLEKLFGSTNENLQTHYYCVTQSAPIIWFRSANEVCEM